jgi:hypothetical protein
VGESRDVVDGKEMRDGGVVAAAYSQPEASYQPPEFELPRARPEATGTSRPVSQPLT